MRLEKNPIKGMMALAGAMGAAAALAAASPAGVNPDLEKGREGWGVPTPNFSIQDGAGRNGSKGLVWEGKDPQVYNIANYAVPFRPGQKLRISVWMKNESLSKGEPGFCIEFFGKNGGYLTGTGNRLAPNQKVEKGKWLKYVAETGPIPPAAARCSVDLYVGKGITGRCVYDDIEVETLGFEDKGLFFSTAPDDKAYEGRFRLSATTYADLRTFKDGDIEAAFWYDGPKGRCRTKADTFRNGRAELLMDAKQLKVGKQRILFKVTAKDGRELDKAFLAFERLAAPAQAKVWFDEHRRLIVDGQPTYPLLVYISGDVENDPRAMPSLDKSPFRMVMSYTRYMTKEQLDLYRAHGIRIFSSFCSAMEGAWNVPVEIGSREDELAFIAPRIEKLKDHPAILGWYLADEPTSSNMSRCRERYKLARALDPEHVVLNVLCHGRQGRETQCCCDVVGLDCYPVPGHGTEADLPANLGTAAQQTREALFGIDPPHDGIRGDKPFWFVPQAFPNCDGRARFPTFREMRSMVWQSIACGADGQLFYSLGEMLSNKEKPGYNFNEAWDITCRVAREIKDREQILLTTEPAPAISGLPKGVVARAWKLGDRKLFVAVNTTHKPVSGTVTVGGEKIDLALGGDEVLLK